MGRRVGNIERKNKWDYGDAGMALIPDIGVSVTWSLFCASALTCKCLRFVHFLHSSKSKLEEKRYRCVKSPGVSCAFDFLPTSNTVAIIA